LHLSRTPQEWTIQFPPMSTKTFPKRWANQFRILPLSRRINQHSFQNCTHPTEKGMERCILKYCWSKAVSKCCRRIRTVRATWNSRKGHDSVVWKHS
jgi:hypothetical protein